MWNGGPSNHHHRLPDSSNGSDPAKLALAATALAAYTGVAHPVDTGYATFPPQVIYQAQAMEAMRRQEEMRRHQAYLAMQQEAARSYSAPATHHRGDHHPHDESSRAYSPMAAKELRDSSSSEEEDEEVHDDEHYRSSNHHDSVEDIPIATAPPEAEADEEAEVFIVEEAPPPKKKRAILKKPRPSVVKPKKSPPKAATGPSIEDSFPPISDQEYENVEKLMMQFCRVPLLAEFSRPVSLLHPEVSLDVFNYRFFVLSYCPPVSHFSPCGGTSCLPVDGGLHKNRQTPHGLGPRLPWHSPSHLQRYSVNTH